MTDWEAIYAEEIEEHIKRNGMSGIDELFKEHLERWKKEDVNIGITGNSGVGKSSFINAIRGLHDDDDGAAPVDVYECTTELISYDHPTHPNVKFWDLAGIGTPIYPDLETYRQKVQLEKYQTYLMFSSTRFTMSDIILAKEIRKQGKSFFFIRTKIDENVRAEMRKKSFNEATMLQKIRRNCIENLVDEAGKPIGSEDDIYLISNHHPDKWDFSRLTKAILDALPRFQREALTMSLSNLTSLSKDVLKRKVDVLKGRIILVAGLSAVAEMALVPGPSIAFDATHVSDEVDEYKTQLGIPVEGSERFGRLSSVVQKKILDLNIKLANSLQLASEATVKGFAGFACYIPIVGSLIATSSSFGRAYTLLRDSLREIEEVALTVLEENCLIFLRS